VIIINVDPGLGRGRVWILEIAAIIKYTLLQQDHRPNLNDIEYGHLPQPWHANYLAICKSSNWQSDHLMMGIYSKKSPKQLVHYKVG
jgi:hypothetical protein